MIKNSNNKARTELNWTLAGSSFLKLMGSYAGFSGFCVIVHFLYYVIIRGKKKRRRRFQQPRLQPPQIPPVDKFHFNNEITKTIVNLVFSFFFLFLFVVVDFLFCLFQVDASTVSFPFGDYRGKLNSLLFFLYFKFSNF